MIVVGSPDDKAARRRVSVEGLTRVAEQGFTEAVTLRESLEGVMIPEQLSEAPRLEAQGFMVR